MNTQVIGSIAQSEAAAIEARKITDAIGKLAKSMGKDKAESQRVLMLAFDHASTHQTAQVIQNFWGSMQAVLPHKACTQLKTYILKSVEGITFEKEQGFKKKKSALLVVDVAAIVALGNWYDVKFASAAKQESRAPLQIAQAALDSLGRKEGCDLIAVLLGEYMQSKKFTDLLTERKAGTTPANNEPVILLPEVLGNEVPAVAVAH